MQSLARCTDLYKVHIASQIVQAEKFPAVFISIGNTESGEGVEVATTPKGRAVSPKCRQQLLFNVALNSGECGDYYTARVEMREK